jgi:eukaryotic-like serine/threonine-protein kinase
MRVVCLSLSAMLAAACSEPVSIDWKRQLQAPSVSTPLVTGSFIAIGNELGLAVLEPNGTPRCAFTTARDVISAPKSDGKLIFFGSTNYLFYAVDTGCTEVWKFATGDRIKSDPLVDGKRVFISSYDGHVYALDAATGTQLWMFPPVAPAKIDLPPPPPPEPKPAKPKKKGKGKADVEPEPSPPPPPPPVVRTIKVGDFSYSSPAIANGVIYVGNLDHNMYAIDAQTGTLRGQFSTGGPVTSSPLIVDNTLYFGSNDGNVYAVDLLNNNIRWKFLTKDWVNSSPRFSEGVLYIGSNDRHLYALDPAAGTIKWSFETEGPAIAAPAFYKNLVIAAGGSGDGSIYALQRADGSEFWKYRTGGKIESDPIVVADKLYVSSTDQLVYAFSFLRTTAE